MTISSDIDVLVKLQINPIQASLHPIRSSSSDNDKYGSGQMSARETLVVALQVLVGIGLSRKHPSLDASKKEFHKICRTICVRNGRSKMVSLGPNPILIPTDEMIISGLLLTGRPYSTAMIQMRAKSEGMLLQMVLLLHQTCPHSFSPFGCIWKVMAC
ncbi:hypothetical protein K7432_012291 [Basidiobolus ranarum]|uniref:Uncharacterized protein n=1 Tax=Basidiobolus ranarum TaxID=34480 RepID=A0ABR2WL38_9FUNG